MKYRSLYLSILGVLIIVIASFSVSYAYLSAQAVTGNDETNKINTTIAKYGTLTVAYHGTDGTISLGAIDLKYSTKGTPVTGLLKFKVTGDSTQTVQTSYNINWAGTARITNTLCQYASGISCTNNSSNTYVGNEMTYTLYSCSNETIYNAATTANTASTCTSIKSATAVPYTDAEKAGTIVSGQTITAGTSKFYVILLSMANLSAAQDYQAGGTFRGAITVQPVTN